MTRSIESHVRATRAAQGPSHPSHTSIYREGGTSRCQLGAILLLRNKPAGTGRDPAAARLVSEERAMITYYQGHTAHITDRSFEVWYPWSQRYSLAELQNVHIIRTGPDPLALRVVLIGTATVVALVAVSPFRGSPTSWLIAGMLVTALAVLARVRWRRNPPQWVLRATYRGYQVELFRSSDTRVFGQVRRGLQRALEGARES